MVTYLLTQMMIAPDKRRFNVLCKDALNTLPWISHNQQRVEFSLPNKVTESSRATMRYVYSSAGARRRIQTVMDGMQYDPVTHITLSMNGDELRDFSKTHIDTIFKQGYIINDADVTLEKHLPQTIRDGGAGYDWIPDEDDYDTTSLLIGGGTLALHPLATPHKDEIIRWFMALKKQYHIDSH